MKKRHQILIGVACVLSLSGACSEALAAPGPVVGWGDRNPVMFPPDSVNGVHGTARAISAGISHVCAIQDESGAVVCWGSNFSGESTPPAEVNGASGAASAITVGGEFSCAIQKDSGVVFCWGRDVGGVLNPPDAVNGALGTASHISAGYSHACAIVNSTGSVTCWGLLPRDTLGDPVPVPDSVNGTLGHASATGRSTERFILWPHGAAAKNSKGACRAPRGSGKTREHCRV